MSKTKPTHKEAWNKEFDKKFTRKALGLKEKGKYMDGWFVRETTAKDLKDFIRSDHARIKKELLEKVKKIFPKNEPMTGNVVLLELEVLFKEVLD